MQYKNKHGVREPLLKTLRKKLGLSIDDVSRRLGISPKTYYAYEEGGRIPLLKYYRLMEILHIEENVYTEDYEVALWEVYGKLIGLVKE